MIELGKKIAFHRKRLGLTQAELGEKMNVTAQAVSKWENGLSDPDLGTLQRLSKFFGVSTDELITNGTETSDELSSIEKEGPAAEEEPTFAESVPTGAPAAVLPLPTASETAPAQATVENRVVIGYCRGCKKPIAERDVYFLKHGGRGSSDYLLCDACEKQRQITERHIALIDEEKGFRRGMIWGPVSGGAVAIAFTIAALATGKYAIFAGLILALAVFTLVSQLFWGEWLFDFLGFFIHAFHMPGVIFTLDLDGIIWLITVKLTLAILAGLLSVIVFVIGLVIVLIVGIFTYPFALGLKIRKIKKLRAEYEAIKK